MSHAPHHTQGYCGGLLYDGQYIVNYTDIILVTINYRLGALGFLVYGSNLEIGGNYGLKVHILSWIIHLWGFSFEDYYLLQLVPTNISNHNMI